MTLIRPVLITRFSLERYAHCNSTCSYVIFVRVLIKVDVELIGKIIRTWKDGPHKSAWQFAHLF